MWKYVVNLMSVQRIINEKLRPKTEALEIVLKG